jgi:hypothetical protein
MSEKRIYERFDFTDILTSHKSLKNYISRTKTLKNQHFSYKNTQKSTFPFQKHQKPSLPGCITLTCLLNNNQRDLVWFKFSLCLFNLMMGTVFVCLFYRYGRKLNMRREKRVSSGVNCLKNAIFCLI